MSLDSVLQDMQRAVPECVATGFVDMKTGMLLGVKTVDSHPQEVLDLVAAATGDLFQGQNVSAIENMFKKGRGIVKDNHHYFQEIVILSDNLIHVFQRCKRNEDLVVVAVCRVSANLGMVLTRSRMHLEKVEAGRAPVIYGDGSQSRDFTNVGDIAQAIQRTLEYPENLGHTIFNVGTSHDTNLNDLVALIGELMGVDVTPEYIPNPVGKGYVQQQLANLDRVTRVLGYEPTISLREGIQEILETRRAAK